VNERSFRARRIATLDNISDFGRQQSEIDELVTFRSDIGYSEAYLYIRASSRRREEKKTWVQRFVLLGDWNMPVLLSCFKEKKRKRRL
jgi:hypothetical protein